MHTSMGDFVMCMEMPAWTPAVTEVGETLLKMETWTSPISHSVVNRVHLVIGHHAVQEVIANLWDIEKFVPIWFHACLLKNTKRHTFICHHS